MKGLASAFLALGLAAAAPAAAQAPIVSAVDWAERVEATPEGGYRMGDPNAPVKLVEYASITCSHCADFNEAAGASLRNRVRSGQVSWEVRPYMIFPSDPGIFMLLQCQAPGQFFATSDLLYETQEAWNGRIQADVPRLRALPREQQRAAIVKSAGVDQVFRERGMTDAQIDACLADETRYNRLVAAQQQADAAGVTGTPTFFLNGQQVNVGSWPQLEALLAAAAPTRGAGAGERGR